MLTSKQTLNSIPSALVVELTNVQAEQVCAAGLITPAGSAGNGRPTPSTGGNHDSDPESNTAPKSNSMPSILGTMNLTPFFPALPAHKLSALTHLSPAGKTSNTTTSK